MGIVVGFILGIICGVLGILYMDKAVSKKSFYGRFFMTLFLFSVIFTVLQFVSDSLSRSFFGNAVTALMIGMTIKSF